MAKQQTFGDKLKKKKADTRVFVKVISTFRTDKGSMRFTQKLVALEDASQMDKVQIN